ncbi:hypothetical protein niasHT_039184 [Heterodera trifolii]|uniref:Uncharacterized protein n=1 Tax=Heterodera trifolii TaxID=157864 RepID=A0ABD2I3N1_9BILA
MLNFAIGRIVLKDECRKEFFATADQLQEMALDIFAAADKQTENGKFFEKGFDIFCCTAIKAENDAMEKDELALIDEFEANQRNFCHQLKKGQNIWEAVESSAGNAIVTAARNVKVNPQTYEGLRKLTKMQSLSHENQTEIGIFAKHCIATLKIFQQFIADKRLAQSFLSVGGQTVSDQSSTLSDQPAPTRPGQLPKEKSSRRRKRSRKWPKCVGAFALAGFSGYYRLLFYKSNIPHRCSAPPSEVVGAEHRCWAFQTTSIPISPSAPHHPLTPPFLSKYASKAANMSNTLDLCRNVVRKLLWQKAIDLKQVAKAGWFSKLYSTIVGLSSNWRFNALAMPPKRAGHFGAELFGARRPF